MHVYLVGWPNGTWSVLGFGTVPEDDEFTMTLDAIGDPSVASVFKVKTDALGDFMFDFPSPQLNDGEKPSLPFGFGCGDIVPIKLYGDLKDEWEKEIALESEDAT